MQDRQPLGVFVGRAAELAQMAEVMAAVAAGQPWLVAVVSEPAVGKTALARRALAGAGLRVLPARADRAETDLDFGLVDQLLRAAGAGFERLADGGGAAGWRRPPRICTGPRTSPPPSPTGNGGC